MDRQIIYLENGVARSLTLGNCNLKEIKERMVGLKITKILKPRICKCCKGEGYNWIEDNKIYF